MGWKSSNAPSSVASLRCTWPVAFQDGGLQDPNIREEPREENSDLLEPTWAGLLECWDSQVKHRPKYSVFDNYYWATPIRDPYLDHSLVQRQLRLMFRFDRGYCSFLTGIRAGLHSVSLARAGVASTCADPIFHLVAPESKRPSYGRFSECGYSAFASKDEFYARGNKGAHLSQVPVPIRPVD